MKFSVGTTRLARGAAGEIVAVDGGDGPATASAPHEAGEQMPERRRAAAEEMRRERRPARRAGALADDIPERDLGEPSLEIQSASPEGVGSAGLPPQRLREFWREKRFV